MNSAVGPLDKIGTQWAPYLEWSLDNPSYSGNPFDLAATATFTHTASGETRLTEMFYSGGTTWKLRFTGTRTGEWTFTTSSSDPELIGHSGTVTINPNPDSSITGFLTSQNNKFALQVGESGRLKGFLFNAFQHQETDVGSGGPHIRDSGILQVGATFMNTYLAEARENGFNVVFFLPMDPMVWTNGTNPRLEMFDTVDLVVTMSHEQGMRVHFWLWGDAERGYTPPGGKMSTEDKRLLSYISARMAPLPGWTMGYGFDLQEWTTEEDTRQWAEYMHQRMGWPHMLWARGRSDPELDVVSYSGLHNSYNDAVANLDGDTTRPHYFEERDYYERAGATMDWTRRHLWLYAMAGGHGGHWGFQGTTDIGSWTYPQPEQLRTHLQFWQTNERFLLDMVPNNAITDGFAVKTPDNENYVFYKEDTSAIQIDIAGAAGPLPAVAVDAKSDYAEIDLGILDAADQVMNLPYTSDWAIAVGTFGAEAVADNTPPSAPTGLSATAAGQSQIDLSWAGASDAESGIASYNIYGDGSLVTTTTGLSFSDTGLTEDTSYTYEVSAVNGVGLEGPKSNPVTQSTLADTTAPTIAGVSASGDGVGVIVVFSEAVDETSATSAANYGIDNGITIASASLGADLKIVTLGTSSHTEGVSYTLTVSNVMDRATVPNSVAPNTQVSYSFVAQVVITGLTVASGEAYEVVDNGLDTGASVYIDRTYTFSSVPSTLAGATYIKTANDDKGRTEEDFMSFTVNQDVTVHVAYDVRATSLPGWLSGWADTGTTLGTTELVDRQLYAKSFAAGTVSLGGNMAAGASGAESSYSVVIGGAGPILPTLPGMSAPAQDLDGDGLAEDTNGNGLFDFADIVALFVHLDSFAVQDNKAVFDFDGNGSVDSSDVVALFDMLVS